MFILFIYVWIDDHYCLNFIFISYFLRITSGYFFGNNKLPLEIQLSRREVGIPLICLNPPHICVRLKERPGFPTSYVVAFLCSVKRRDDCSFCWYWWKWWSSLFILSFRGHVVLSGMNAVILEWIRFNSIHLYVASMAPPGNTVIHF